MQREVSICFPSNRGDPGCGDSKIEVLASPLSEKEGISGCDHSVREVPTFSLSERGGFGVRY